MRLTKEEIEQERVKFEDWYKVKYQFSYDFGALIKDAKNNYKNELIDRLYRGWIARAGLEKENNNG